MKLAKVLYIVGVLLWVGYVSLFPTWVGRLYNEDVQHPGVFYVGGAFGLSGGGPFEAQAPLWNPARPHSDAISAPVRWPGQRISQRAHVELSLSSTVSRLTLGVLLLGAILRGTAWLLAGDKQGGLVTLAWCLTLSLTLAWICMFMVAAFTMGYGLTDGVVITLLMLGLAAGLVYGVAAVRRKASPQAKESVKSEAADNRAPAAALMWFTVGTVAAVCLTVAASWIAALFRGPVIGVWELGTPRYASDQTIINVITGVAILATGWIIGLLIRRRRVARGLPLGLIVGSTLLGIAYTLWH